LSLDNITGFMLPRILSARESSGISIERLEMKREMYVGFNFEWIFLSEEDEETEAPYENKICRSFISSEALPNFESITDRLKKT